MRWLIQGAIPLSWQNENSKIEPLDILIDGDIIIAVENGLVPENLGVERVVPANGKLVIPGLINAHIHSHDRFDKGRFDNLPLEIWMGLYNPPLAHRDWSARECYLRTILSCIENIKCGTTTVIDDLHAGFPVPPECLNAVFQAYQDIGLRAQVSIACSDKPFYQSIPYLEELLPDRLKPKSGFSVVEFQKMVLDLWRNFAEMWNDRVQFILSPSGPQRCTDEFLKMTRDLCEELDLPVVIHVLETRVQEFSGREFYGKTIVEHLDALGLLNHLSALVHCVWVNANDIEIIAKKQTSIIHNPISNLKLGSGIAPVGKMLQAGINVGLGTDNHNASDTANIFEAMKTAALIHKVSTPDYKKWIGAKEAFRMATIGGAGCGGLDKHIGSIEVGMKADIVLLDLNQPSFLPRNNLLNQLVFCEHGEAVETVIVGGEIIMQAGKIMNVEEDLILNEIEDHLEEIRSKILSGVKMGKELEPYLQAAYFRCTQDL